MDEFGRAALDSAGEISSGKIGKLRSTFSGGSASFQGVHNFRVGERQTIGSLKDNAQVMPDGSFIETVFERLASIVSHPPRKGIVVTKRVKSLRPRPKRMHIRNDGWTYPVNIEAARFCDLAIMRDRKQLPFFEDLGK